MAPHCFRKAKQPGVVAYVLGNQDYTVVPALKALAAAILSEIAFRFSLSIVGRG